MINPSQAAKLQSGIPIVTDDSSPQLAISKSLASGGSCLISSPSMGSQYMRVAALYDIHGNLPALEAVLADVDQAGVDRIVIGGDVLPGPMPRESLDRLLALDIPVDFLRGNGEAAVLAQLGGRELGTVPEAAREAVRWVAKQLQPADECLIARWPQTLGIAIAGLGDVLFCHATPRSDTEIFTRLTPEDRLVPVFEGLDVPLVVCGHTHMQFDRTIGVTRVVNAGSVGMPFGKPGAYWALLGPDVLFRHTPYDLPKAAERIRLTRYPRADDFAQRNVLEPPSEAQILASFSKAELQRPPA
jgi:predicted phosphodiesterase